MNVQKTRQKAEYRMDKGEMRHSLFLKKVENSYRRCIEKNVAGMVPFTFLKRERCRRSGTMVSNKRKVTATRAPTAMVVDILANAMIGSPLYPTTEESDAEVS